MTRAVRDRILKDANGDISDHLRNHIHLTNCIHLKNHMHKHSPILGDRSLMRDLVVLQRSRSLKDPSASPASWQSPSVVEKLSKKGEHDSLRRRSVGREHRMEGRRLLANSPPLASFGMSRVAPDEANRENDGVAAVSEHGSKSGVRDGRRMKREESSQTSNRSHNLGGKEESPLNQNAHDLTHDTVSRNSESRSRKSKHKGKNVQGVQMKTLSEQLNEVRMDSDDLVSSNIHLPGRRPRQERNVEEPAVSIRGNCSAMSRVKRRRFRGARRSRASVASRDVGAHNDLSVASNNVARRSAHSKHHMEPELGEEEYDEQNVTRAPGNGCGIPWNWSRIHHRGKSFLDVAGRSFSCGMSDSRFKKGGLSTPGRDISDMPMASDNSSSSTKYDADALPLLVDASGPHESTGWAHDYSGELGIYADNLFKNDLGSEYASEARSGDQRNMRGHRHGRHQSLTQKYMPKTFRDLVGQNLVVQALSNAVMKKKVGLLYVFYGPHGTGKTSCARIFARALNCQSLDHPKPCGFCDSCIAHDLGKNRNIKEVGPVSNFDYESIVDLLDNMSTSRQASQFRVFIFDDCDTLSQEYWSAISKVIDRAPRRVVFVLVCSSLDVLPHIIISRCHKFFFPKLKDADIIYSLQWIATKDELEIDKDALKLIASRSDGSLRDAEMTLEQLSLLGQRISVPLVQELVGLISDERLVDLLDLALSADTVNTVKNLRVIMESGVEPLALMPQLATVITDILAGSYDYTKEGRRRKFFRRQPLSKDDMEKLRQALKTLSEAEKQLRTSNDKLTWLTAALLQLAPDQQYLLPSSSAGTSNHSPWALNNAAGRRDVPSDRGLPSNVRNAGSSGQKQSHAGESVARATSSAEIVKGRNSVDGSIKAIEEIWLEVLEKIPYSRIKEFLYQEGKLISVSFSAAPSVQLMFSSHMTKSTAEKFKAQILQAFEMVLGSPMTVEIRCLSKEGDQKPIIIPDKHLHSDTREMGKSEIVEVAASPRETKGGGHIDNHRDSSARAGEASIQHRMGEQSQSLSLVRGKVSLAHVIQQAEGCSQRNRWSQHKAVSIAEKLEQDNLRLESQSRSLICWKASRVACKKLSRLKIRTRRPHSLLKLVFCGKCRRTRSPR